MTTLDQTEEQRMSIFAETESDISESDDDEVLEEDFFDLQRRRSMKRHRSKSNPVAVSKRDQDVLLSPQSNKSGKSSTKLLSEASLGSSHGTRSPRSMLSAHTPNSTRTASPRGISQLNLEDLSESESEDHLYITPPSTHLLCAICSRVLKRPVITQCGHTFCARCVLEGSTETCPADGAPLALVMENISLRDQIGSLMIYCKFGCAAKADGGLVYSGEACTEKLNLSSRKKHEGQCLWSIVQCPNSSSCGTLLAKDLAEHTMECVHAACCNAEFGCAFTGTSNDVDDHEDNCKFTMVRTLIENFKSTVDQLQQKVDVQSKHIKSLHKTVAVLKEEKTKREKKTDSRVEVIETAQSNFSDSLNETRSMLNEMSTEMSNIQSQLGIVGNIENHVYKCKGTFVGHSGPVWSMASTGDLLFSASSDETIKVWDTLANFTCLKTLKAHEGMVLALAVHQSTKLFSSASDCQICVWDIKSFNLIDTIKGHNHPFSTLAVSDKYLFSGSLRVIKVWDVNTMELVKVLEGLNHWVRSMYVKSNKLYSGTYQNISVWDAETFECEHNIDVKGGSVYSLLVTDQWIICGTYEKCIHIFSRTKPREGTTLTGHSGTVYALGVLTSGGLSRLFSGAYDRSIRVWNLDSQMCLQTLLRHQGSVTCLTIAKGKIFSAAMDSHIKVWQ